MIHIPVRNLLASALVLGILFIAASQAQVPEAQKHEALRKARGEAGPDAQ